MPKQLDAVALARLALELPEPPERRAIRERAHISLRQMARTVDVSETTIWLWEEGRRFPSERLLPRYMQVLRDLAALDRDDAQADRIDGGAQIPGRTAPPNRLTIAHIQPTDTPTIGPSRVELG